MSDCVQMKLVIYAINVFVMYTSKEHDFSLTWPALSSVRITSLMNTWLFVTKLCDAGSSASGCCIPSLKTHLCVVVTTVVDDVCPSVSVTLVVVAKEIDKKYTHLILWYAMHETVSTQHSVVKLQSGKLMIQFINQQITHDQWPPLDNSERLVPH